jgi:hypothetical protein
MHEFRQSQRASQDKSNGTSKKKSKSTTTATTKAAEAAKATINGTSHDAVMTTSANSAASPTLPSSDEPTVIPDHPPLQPHQIHQQTPQALSLAIRKHFNAQQLNEAETIARFLYITRDDARREGVSTEGSGGDGHGWVMGSQGREVRREEGGGVGFRLRFRAR